MNAPGAYGRIKAVALVALGRGGAPAGGRSPGLLTGLGAYFAFTLSKGLWMPLLPAPLFWAADVIGFVVLPLLLVHHLQLPLLPRCAVGKEGRSRYELPWGAVIFMGVLAACGLWFCALLAAYLVRKFGLIDLLPAVLTYSDKIPKGGGARLLVTLYFAATAALVEEAIYRGYVSRLSKEVFGDRALPFIVVSTLTFGAVHWAGGTFNLIGALLSGALLAIVYLRTGDLRVPIVAHGLYWLRHLAG